MPLLLLLSLSLFALSTAVSASQLRLFHRLHDPLGAPTPFVERGVVKIAADNVASFHPSSAFEDAFNSATDAPKNTPHQLFYQVALERPGDNVQSQWDISSVKACHLSLTTSETIYLHSRDLHNPSPYAIDYFISPVPHNGDCPRSRQTPVPSLSNSVNTTVILRGTSFPPVPTLIPPPPLTPEGEPVLPVPEKTFLQKYWMYILALFILILVTGGEEDLPRKQD